MVTNKYTNSFEERQNVDDMADMAMLKHLQNTNLSKNVQWAKLGPDAKENFVPVYWLVSQIIVCPDYVVSINDKLYLIEVKGTNKIKLDDYEKLEEMYTKAIDMDGKIKIEIAVMYFKHPDAIPVWITFTRLKKMWDSIKEFKEYPERDFQGKPKLYKVLPLV